MLKIFLLHGMGHHPADVWANSAIEKLHEKWIGHGLPESFWINNIKFIPINYDKIFVDIVSGWSDRAKEISALAKPLGADLVSDLTSWAEEASDPTKFVFSHATDVLLYRLASLVRVRVQDHVAEKIVAELQDNPSWGVIGHSLGTIVAHDTLHRIWINNFTDKDFANKTPGIGQARFVAMIANVTRLAQTDFDVYDESLVKPGIPDQPGRMCRHYLTVDHRVDPFAQLVPFDRTDWVEDSLWNAKRYQRIVPRHIWSKNVHDLVHYLEHPAVHIPLLRLFWSENKLSRPSWETHDAAVTAFPNFPGLGPAAGVAAEDALDRIIRKTPPHISALVRLSRAFQAFIEE